MPASPAATGACQDGGAWFCHADFQGHIFVAPVLCHVVAQYALAASSPPAFQQPGNDIIEHYSLHDDHRESDAAGLPGSLSKPKRQVAGRARAIPCKLALPYRLVGGDLLAAATIVQCRQPLQGLPHCHRALDIPIFRNRPRGHWLARPGSHDEEARALLGNTIDRGICQSKAKLVTGTQ